MILVYTAKETRAPIFKVFNTDSAANTWAVEHCEETGQIVYIAPVTRQVATVKKTSVAPYHAPVRPAEEATHGS